MLARRDKLTKALVLVPGHRPVAAPLQREVRLKVRVQVLLERHVAHESHAAEGAVELDAAEYLTLRGL